MMDQLSETDGEQGNVIPVTLDAAFFFERAVRSLDRFQYDKALKHFRRTVEYEPENPVNHCNLAGVLSEMGDYGSSNDVLAHVLDSVDPELTECYFYMANNYANMEQFEEAERCLIRYLEEDPEGEFLQESEELMDLLCYELKRPAPSVRIRSREGMAEHDRARELLEAGKMTEAVSLLEDIVAATPDFHAARNNLALAYFYMGRLAKSRECVLAVLELAPDNLHALCNLAIFMQYEGDNEGLAQLLAMLEKIVPFHREHVFKLATTMGILGSHRSAYGHFRRLFKDSETAGDAVLLHYCAAAAANSGLVREAAYCWKQASRLDPDSPVPRFYLNHLQQMQQEEETFPVVSYNYQLPFQELLKRWKEDRDGLAAEIRGNLLLRSSFFWAMRYGDDETRHQIGEALEWIGDDELSAALQELDRPSRPGEKQEQVLLRLQKLIGGVEGDR